MKKILSLIILITITISCEKDNICIDETTPHLIIRFYNSDDTSKLKGVTNLKVAVQNSLDEIIEIGAVATKDSIAIPLNVDVDFSKIYLTKNVNDTSVGIEDSFELNYTREEVFVSRSCGYKTLYNNVSITNSTNNWINNFSLLTTHISDENNAHINIFH